MCVILSRLGTPPCISLQQQHSVNTFSAVTASFTFNHKRKDEQNQSMHDHHKFNEAIRK